MNAQHPDLGVSGQRCEAVAMDINNRRHATQVAVQEEKGASDEHSEERAAHTDQKRAPVVTPSKFPSS